mmetsp:Transcript_67118/g.212420  ORF Transcript_67118/g.212420 Transcript_67118/m.212420 type:complete len:210 (-) Transcript_67118:1653-2282(-)
MISSICGIFSSGTLTAIETGAKSVLKAKARLSCTSTGTLPKRAQKVERRPQPPPCPGSPRQKVASRIPLRYPSRVVPLAWKTTSAARELPTSASCTALRTLSSALAFSKVLPAKKTRLLFSLGSSLFTYGTCSAISLWLIVCGGGTTISWSGRWHPRNLAVPRDFVPTACPMCCMSTTSFIRAGILTAGSSGYAFSSEVGQYRNVSNIP